MQSVKYSARQRWEERGGYVEDTIFTLNIGINKPEQKDIFSYIISIWADMPEQTVNSVVSDQGLN